MLKLYLFVLSLILIGCGGINSALPNSNTEVAVPINLSPDGGGIKNGESDVSLSPIIVMSFAQAMDSTTINKDSIQLTSIANTSYNLKQTTNNSVLISDITANNAKTVFSFGALEPLVANTKYYIQISNKVKTSTGKNIVPQQFSFSTGSNDKPLLALLLPNYLGNNSITPLFQVQFSKPVQNINQNSIHLYHENTNSTPITLSEIKQGSANVYNFTPHEKLAELSNYILVFESSITDYNNNPISLTKFTFSTGDYTKPNAIMLSPNNNETNITLLPIIQVIFSESVNNVSLTNVHLRKDNPYSKNIPLAIVNSVAASHYTFSPLDYLTPSSIYYLVLESDICDYNNNQLINTNFSFSTKANDSPSVNLIEPNNGLSISIRPIFKLNFNRMVQNVNNSTIKLYQNSTNTEYSLINFNLGQNNDYSFMPNTDLIEMNNFTLAILPGIRDTYGNSVNPTQFNLSIGDLTTPSVSLLAPNNPNNMAINGSIQLLFNEPVLNVENNTTLHLSTAKGQTISLTPFNQNGSLYTFGPQTPLAYNSTYYLILESAITDLSNNPLTYTNIALKTQNAVENPFIDFPTPVTPVPTVGNYKGIAYSALGNPIGFTKNYPEAFWPQTLLTHGIALQIAYGSNDETALAKLSAYLHMGNYMCSATPIYYDQSSNTTFLVSAAHCVTAKKTLADKMQRSDLYGINQVFAQYGISRNLGTFSTKAIYVPEDYCLNATFDSSGCPNFTPSQGVYNGQGNDIAIIQINGQYAEPLYYPQITTANNYPLEFSAAPILSIGYGLNTQTTTTGQYTNLLPRGELFAVANYFYAQQDTLGYHYLYHSYYNASGAFNQNGYAELVCGGDSGGGDLFWDGSHWLLLSEHTYGLSGCGEFYNSLSNGATNVSSYYAWIQGIITATNPISWCQSQGNNCVVNY